MPVRALTCRLRRDGRDSDRQPGIPLRQGVGVKAGSIALAMQGGDKGGNGETFIGIDLAGHRRGRREQRQITLLRVQSRLRALRAQSVDGVARQDAGQLVNDIGRGR